MMWFYSPLKFISFCDSLRKNLIYLIIYIYSKNILFCIKKTSKSINIICQNDISRDLYAPYRLHLFECLYVRQEFDKLMMFCRKLYISVNAKNNCHAYNLLL